MKYIVLCSTILLTSCAGLVSQNEYPSIEKECEISEDSNSEPCKIASMNDWTEDEKEHHMGFVNFFPNTGVPQDCSKAKYWFEKAEPPRLYRRLIYLSQAVMPDRIKLS